LPPTLYLGLDGTGIPMPKEELVGRPSKQPDGSAQTREVKICAIWSAEARDAEGRPRRDAGSVSYSAPCRDTDLQVAEFHTQDLCTSSGVLEAGCKVVVGSRLKPSGMPWTVRRSNAIIALLGYKFSDRFEDF
jgi:hypothetical protein